MSYQRKYFSYNRSNDRYLFTNKAILQLGSVRPFHCLSCPYQTYIGFKSIISLKSSINEAVKQTNINKYRVTLHLSCRDASRLSVCLVLEINIGTN